MTIPETAVEAAARALESEGGTPGSSIHGWRCEHPDRYGPCTCVRGSAKEILDAAGPLIAAAALREAADAWQRGQWADAPRRPDRVAERIANAQHVTDWIRSRADELEAGVSDA